MKLDFLISEFRNVLKKGFFHVLFSSVMSKLIRFAATLIVVQLLSKSDFGVYSYVQNIFRIILLLDGLGIATGMLQFCSKASNDEIRFEFLKFGLRIGILVNILVSLISLVIFIVSPLPVEEARVYLIALAFVPIIRITYTILEVYIRSLLLNKRYGLLIVINSVLYFIVLVGLTYFEGINGLIWAEYSVFIFGVVLASIFLRNHWKYFKTFFSRITSVVNKREVIVFSVVASAATMISQLLYLLDQFLIGVLVSDTLVIASYNVSTVIPYNMNIIPASVMIFIYPYFAKKSDDLFWIRTHYRKLTLYLFAFNASLSAILILFAKPIVLLIFGEQYIDSVEIFRILMLGYFIAGTFRIPQGNILAALGKVKANFVISILSGVVNVAAAWLLIVEYGPKGAAYATLLVFAFSSVLSYFYLKKVLAGQGHA